MRRNLFGYNAQDVKNAISEKDKLIDLQRRDIEHLKQDNLRLRGELKNLISNFIEDKD